VYLGYTWFCERHYAWSLTCFASILLVAVYLFYRYAARAFASTNDSVDEAPLRCCCGGRIGWLLLALLSIVELHLPFLCWESWQQEKVIEALREDKAIETQLEGGPQFALQSYVFSLKLLQASSCRKIAEDAIPGIILKRASPMYDIPEETSFRAGIPDVWEGQALECSRIGLQEYFDSGCEAADLFSQLVEDPNWVLHGCEQERLQRSVHSYILPSGTLSSAVKDLRQTMYYENALSYWEVASPMISVMGLAWALAERSAERCGAIAFWKYLLYFLFDIAAFLGGLAFMMACAASSADAMNSASLFQKGLILMTAIAPAVLIEFVLVACIASGEFFARVRFAAETFWLSPVASLAVADADARQNSWKVMLFLRAAALPSTCIMVLLIAQFGASPHINLRHDMTWLPIVCVCLTWCLQSLFGTYMLKSMVEVLPYHLRRSDNRLLTSDEEEGPSTRLRPINYQSTAVAEVVLTILLLGAVFATGYLQGKASEA